MLIAAAFSAKCVLCNMYHTSYYNTANGQQYLYPPDESQPSQI